MNRLQKTLGVVAATAVVMIANKYMSDTLPVADPPLPAKRSWVLHTSIAEQVAGGTAAQVNISPFNDEELCRAALATANSRQPRDYRVVGLSNERIVFSFVRPSDKKQFHYWCRIE